MTTANLLLTFGNKVQVTIEDNGKWVASGDPYQVLQEDSGTWAYHPTAGTELSGKRDLQIILVGWSLSTAFNGQEGTAYRVPQEKNELGYFQVQLFI